MTDLLSALLLGGGLFLGAIISWLISRSFYSSKIEISSDKAKSQEEYFSEKLARYVEENSQLVKELAESRNQANDFRQALSNSQEEKAKLVERTNRLPELSQALEKAKVDGSDYSQKLSDLREKYGSAESTIAAYKKQLDEYSEDVAALKSFRAGLLEEKEDLQTRLATIEAELEAEKKQGKEKIALLNEAKEELSNQFKALANDILEEKSKRFDEQNKSSLNELLKPLQAKLGDFQNKVEEVYIKEGKERSAMAEQIRQVMDLNRQLSTDAHNLTRALKGQSKAQGNWGEMILERVLEVSGLRKGHEYEVQESVKCEDGKRLQPDVVIHLPESRHLVIDAKVSLIAYEAYVNSEDEGAKEIAAKRHLESIRNHINGLSSKDYQSLYSVESLDFVIMFVPVEPAFTLASHRDAALWQDAWNKNVLLVSPSTLLFVIRTVAHVWRQEQQSRNAHEIAKRGGDLYNKFVGFVEDLLKIGERLDQAKAVYDGASKKLSTGRGNLVRQAEMLKALGVKPKKGLPPKVLHEIDSTELAE